MGLCLKRIEYCVTIKFTEFSKFKYKFLIFIDVIKIPKLKSGRSKVGAKEPWSTHLGPKKGNYVIFMKKRVNSRGKRVNFSEKK